MSRLTNELVGGARPRSEAMKTWPERFGRVADRLERAHGSPSLGNLLDPVREIFYIVLSARTTDSQYRKTFRALRIKYPRLEMLAKAKIRGILRCIAGGGLANKRAAHVRAIASQLLAELGKQPGRRLREMSPDRIYAFLTNLPGMGPKSALCVMMYSLGMDVFPVDVNVQRVAWRIGAIPRKLKHYQAQKRLPWLIPEGRSKQLHIGLVVHGRLICLPRRPRCAACCILDLCDYGQKRLRRAEGN